MKNARTLLLSPLFCVLILSGITARAQDTQQPEWPKSITMDDGTAVKIYQPESESFSQNVLKSRWAISVLQPGKTDPVFGTFWSVANVETDRDNRQVIIQSVKVPNIKFPGQEDENLTNTLKTMLEAQLPQAVGNLSLDELLSSLDENTEQKKLSKDLNTAAPRIVYTTRPSLLVLIDGQPKFQTNKDWNLDVVVNTPFTIVKNNDGNFYLYGGKHWYTAQSATGPYSPAGNVPSNLLQVQSSVDAASSANAGYVDSASVAQDNTTSDIVVSTSPAELIQTDGQPNWAPIPGTSLSYASNSANDIFQDQNGQYYVLISGRWYASSSLTGGWHFMAANALPPDFAKIPEGSPKDNVLASVAGTPAAREAVMDAQIPQTAKIDRGTASTSVNYNGDPQFAPIDGTNMQYATNTPSSVLEDNGTYYSVDNGVWFQAPSATGPWTACTQRPMDVDQIPPSSPMYNLKYVDIYDVTPDYIYEGYTPGYLNAYVYGPTVVYGTGFYYNPWFGGVYYPRPWTWGFGWGYNPWCGWSIGFGYGFGWFNYGYGFHAGFAFGWGAHWGGWWGPHIYHPPFVWNRNRSYGFYGHNFYRNRNVYINNYRTNIYSNRAGVFTHSNQAAISARYGRGNTFNGAQRANPTVNNNRGAAFNNGFNDGGNRSFRGNTNNVYSDRNGNVYQRNQTNNQWQQRQSNQWKPIQNNPQQVQNLNRQQQMRDRGQTRAQNFQRARSASSSAPARSQPARSSGGSSGGRSGGGGRRF